MRRQQKDISQVIRFGVRLAILRKLFNEIEQLSEEITILETELANERSKQTIHTLPLYTALSTILQDKRAFFEPGTNSFRLKEGSFSKEVEIDPRDLICVFSLSKGREKVFIVREDNTTSGTTKEVYRRYESNNNDYTFEYIKSKIDPISSRFVQISQNVMVNVGYYIFDKKEEIVFNHPINDKLDYVRFPIKMKGATELFTAIKMHWQENYSLQKRITDYMNGEAGTGRP